MTLAHPEPFRSALNTELFAIDVFGTLRRRKWIGVAVVFVGTAVALAGALLWPPTYQSIATILIEEPDVPAEMVQSTVSTFADERLQVIQQRVMTSQNLSDIVDRFGLYKEMLAEKPRSEIIAAMRSKIDLEVVSADLFGPSKPNTNRPKASIAFTVSFASPDPQVAQQVASRLTDLYLAENVQSRTEKAAGTTEFLTQQSVKLYSDVQDFERKLTEFKTKYAGSLPEQLAINMQILAQVQEQLLQNRRDASALTEKKSFIDSQLAQISPYLPMTAGGRPATPQAQLMDLELQYVDLSARYGVKHPDVVHLQKQIEALKAQLGTSDDQVSAQGRLSQMQQQLADALQRYGEKHPEVVKLRGQIAELSADMDKQPSKAVLSAPKGPPDSPIYIQLQGQMGDINAQLQGLQFQTSALETKLQDVQARVLQTPALESEYAALQQQYGAAVKRYQDFKDKEADAQVAQSMEQQSKGETFSVIEAPQLPDIPVKPNRKLLLAAGTVLSFLMAFAAMIGLELLDTRVYEPAGLQRFFGEAPLAAVPYISTRGERIRRRARIGALALVVLACIGGALLFVNTEVMPLDVLVASLMQRLNP
jgi:uncharacterized protein involved in exopolysaccharide biosynthesis